MSGFSQSRFSLPMHKLLVTETFLGNHDLKQSFSSKHAAYCCTSSCFVQVKLNSSIVFGAHSVYFCRYPLLKSWILIKIFPKFIEFIAEEEGNNEW